MRKSPNTSAPPVEVLSLLKISAGENIRDKKNFKKDVNLLEEELEEHGQILPIIVSQFEDSQVYQLQAGERRFAAAQALKWKEIKAVVIPICLDDPPALLKEWVKLVEQHQRYELDHYSIAKTAVRMEDSWKIKASDFARQLGLSNGYVYNLMRWYRAVPEKIKDAWRQNSPLLNQAELERYSHMPKSEALEAWEVRCRMRGNTFEPLIAGKSKKKILTPNTSKGKPKRVSERQISNLQSAVDDSHLIPAVKDLISNILRFVIGIEKDVHGLTDYVKLPLEIVNKNALVQGKSNSREQRTV